MVLVSGGGWLHEHNDSRLWTGRRSVWAGLRHIRYLRIRPAVRHQLVALYFCRVCLWSLFSFLHKACVCCLILGSLLPLHLLALVALLAREEEEGTMAVTFPRLSPHLTKPFHPAACFTLDQRIADIDRQMSSITLRVVDRSSRDNRSASQRTLDTIMQRRIKMELITNPPNTQAATFTVQVPHCAHINAVPPP